VYRCPADRYSTGARRRISDTANQPTHPPTYLPTYLPAAADSYETCGKAAVLTVRKKGNSPRQETSRACVRACVHACMHAFVIIKPREGDGGGPGVFA